jgi:hypothetical protein
VQPRQSFDYLPQFGRELLRASSGICNWREWRGCKHLQAIRLNALDQRGFVIQQALGKISKTIGGLGHKRVYFRRLLPGRLASSIIHRQASLIAPSSL